MPLRHGFAPGERATMIVSRTLTERRPGDPDSMQPGPRITPAEYLEAERKVETRNEYYDGEVFAV
jgi:hypothetical protein